MNKISLRPVLSSDFSKIYHWRNDPQIRKRMFNDKEITLGEHMSYWKKRIKAGHCYILVADGKEVGVAKLDEREGAFEVDIFIDPKEQGKGHGTVALKEVILTAKKAGIKKLSSRIKPENEKSISIFKNNGFKEKYRSYECDLL